MSETPADALCSMLCPIFTTHAAGRNVQLRVRKKVSMEAEDVLDPDAGKSMWGKLWSGNSGGTLGTLRHVLRGCASARRFCRAL